MLLLVLVLIGAAAGRVLVLILTLALVLVLVLVLVLALVVVLVLVLVEVLRSSSVTSDYVYGFQVYAKLSEITYKKSLGCKVTCINGATRRHLIVCGKLVDRCKLCGGVQDVGRNSCFRKRSTR